MLILRNIWASGFKTTELYTRWVFYCLGEGFGGRCFFRYITGLFFSLRFLTTLAKGLWVTEGAGELWFYLLPHVLNSGTGFCLGVEGGLFFLDELFYMTSGCLVWGKAFWVDGVDTGMDCLKVGKSNTVSTIEKGLKVRVRERERECVCVCMCVWGVLF